MNRLLLLILVLLSLSANAQKKPKQTYTPPVITDDPADDEDDVFYIIESPSSHGTFTVTGKEAGKAVKQEVSYVCYGNDTTWMFVCEEAHFIFRSVKPVTLTVKVQKYHHPETVYEIPVTVDGNQYHLDLTPLQETDRWRQGTYTFAIYDDKQQLVHEIHWQLYCVKGTRE